MPNNNKTEPDYFTPQEAAQKSRVSVGTIRRWLNNGLLTKIQPSGKKGHIKIPRDALDQLLKPQDSPEASGKPSKKLPGRTPEWQK